MTEEEEILKRLAVIRSVLRMILKTRRDLHNRLKQIDAMRTRH